MFSIFFPNTELFISLKMSFSISLFAFVHRTVLKSIYTFSQSDYFVRGRHKHISCSYLTKSYTEVDKQLIRNINFLCIFRQGPKYTKDIYDEYVGSDFTFERFKEICN
jgi:hypothetical protein